MELSNFKSPNAGRCVQGMGGYWAFVPADLPPYLSFDGSLLQQLSAADAALGEVAGLAMAGAIPRMHMLLRAFARREAVLSSRIEGTQTQLDDLLMAEVKEGSAEEEHGDLREVQNYLRALHEGVELLKEMPIATRLVLRLHAILMEGVRGGDKTPGEFRRIQNFIGRAGDTIATAKYVPPPPDQVPGLIANWERFVNDRAGYPDLVQCAIMHEHFEAIHPFQDGNGRVGRLLIALFLIERKRLPQPLLPLSVYIEAHRRDYYDLLQQVRTDGDWTSWIRFFLAGVTETARQATAQAMALDALRDGYRSQLSKNACARLLLDELFGNPFITIGRAAERLKVTRPTAQKAIDALRRIGLLEETTGRNWGRMFLARPILAAIENPPETAQ